MNTLVPPTFESPAQMIRTSEDFKALAKDLDGVPQLAVDTESDTYYHYHQKLCLLQLTADGQDFIVDTMAIDDLSPLQALLSDTRTEKLFHSGENDLTLLFRLHNIHVTMPYFDTRVAAQVVGEKKVGLGALVGEHLGIKLDKSFQLFDWSSRPLPADCLKYARCDTHYLVPLRDALWKKVEEKGRTAQALEEFEFLLSRPTLASPFDPNSCLKVKGSKGLYPLQRKILMALYARREALASKWDLAPFRVATNETLLALSRAQPESPDQMRKMRGISRARFDELAPQFLEAILEGMRPGAPEPERKLSTRARLTPLQERKLKAVRKWRVKKSEKRLVEPGVIVSNAVIDRMILLPEVSQEALEDIKDIRKWQLAEFGSEWLQMLAEIQ